jgi:hypothetical protein
MKEGRKGVTMLKPTNKRGGEGKRERRKIEDGLLKPATAMIYALNVTVEGIMMIKLTNKFCGEGK